MNATVKVGWDREGQVCLVLGPNVFVKQLWTPVKWPDEEDPDFYKTAALKFGEPDNSTSTQQTKVLSEKTPKTVCQRCRKFQSERILLWQI